MEDVSEVFKKHFSSLHKGTTCTKTVHDRREVLNNFRKSKRDTLANMRRNINNLSPINTPTPFKGGSRNMLEKPSSPPKAKQEGVKKRLELLQKWKTEKAKVKEQEKARAKPIFKVCHVPSDLTADLENANKVLKGKPIVPGSASKKSQFAPPNHKFKPPSGIKPFSSDASTTQGQSAASTSIRTFNKFRSTLQTRNNAVIKETVSEESRVSGTSKEDLSTPRHASLRSAKENNSKPGIKKNIKETIKPTVSKLNKDKRDELTEEVRKKPVDTSVETKISKNSKTNLGSKNTGTVFKKGTAEPNGQVTRNTRKTEAGKAASAKVADQRTPKKTIGWNVKKSDQNDSNSNSKITYRKTPKKSKGSLGSNERELETNIKKSADTPSLEDTTEGSSKTTSSKSNSVYQNDDNFTTSNDVQLPAQSVENHAVGSSSSVSTDYSVDYDNCSIAPPLPPTVNPDFDYYTSPPVYVSPFVTISRGKNFARKEYKIRKSQGTCDMTDVNKDTPEVKKILSAHTSPKAGAVYFKKKLEAEIERINCMCGDWETYLKDPDLPEEAQSSIDVAIGQSKLLISKKFQQFRSLISQCESENYETKPVTCEDLHGFWDMTYMQVEDLDKRFANLQKLRDNNWEEVLPQKVIPAKRARGRPKKEPTKSKLMQLIQDARKRQIVQQTDGIVLINGLDYPRILQTPPPKGESLDESNSTKRRNSRLSVLKENKTRCSSSPGLTMMKVTQSIKQGDGLTPARSILKTDVCRLTGKKYVVFKDPEESPKNLCKTKLFCEAEKENVSDNLISFSPAPLTPRRSVRLSKLKI